MSESSIITKLRERARQETDENKKRILNSLLPPKNLECITCANAWWMRTVSTVDRLQHQNLICLCSANANEQAWSADDPDRTVVLDCQNYNS